MRLIVDSLIALMLVAILAVVVLHYRQEHRELERIRHVHEALTHLHEQVIYHRAMAQVHEAQVRHARSIDHAAGFPARISPTWFDDDDLPINIFASIRRPWMDRAPEGDHQDHPPDPVLRDEDQAGFWYNPQRGIVRARVPEQITESATLELYNRVNSTALLALPEDQSPGREPQPHGFGLETAPEVVPDSELPLAHRLDEVTHVLPRMLSPRSVEAGQVTLWPGTSAAEKPRKHEADEPREDDADDAASRSDERPTLADRPRPTNDE